MIEAGRLETELSRPFDDLRQTLQDQFRNRVPGPLATFRNQGEALPVMLDAATFHYGLTNDLVLAHKKANQHWGQPYPKDVFDYVVSRAPQIEVGR